MSTCSSSFSSLLPSTCWHCLQAPLSWFQGQFVLNGGPTACSSTTLFFLKVKRRKPPSGKISPHVRASRVGSQVCVLSHSFSRPGGNWVTDLPLNPTMTAQGDRDHYDRFESESESRSVVSDSLRP